MVDMALHSLPGGNPGVEEGEGEGEEGEEEWAEEDGFRSGGACGGACGGEVSDGQLRRFVRWANPWLVPVLACLPAAERFKALEQCAELMGFPPTDSGIQV